MLFTISDKTGECGTVQINNIPADISRTELKAILIRLIQSLGLEVDINTMEFAENKHKSADKMQTFLNTLSQSDIQNN